MRTLATRLAGTAGALSAALCLLWAVLVAPASAGAGPDAHGQAAHGQGVPVAAATAAAVTDTRCRAVRSPKLRARCLASLLPERYPVGRMGVPDEGGGHARHPGAAVSLDSLRGPDGPADRTFTLTAATATRRIGGIRRKVLTFNGSTPGPTLTVTQGDLVEVRLRNRNVARGVTIHWHGVDVPGREDGVAGVTQDAVLPGADYTYRFVVPDAGTYWYHSHQDSLTQVGRGLVGALVVLPATAPPEGAADVDLAGVVHTYDGTRTLNGATGTTRVAVPTGSRVRVRFVNSDNGPLLVSASAPFRVVAIDGTDLAGPTDLEGTYVDIPAGGRADLEVTVGETAVRVGTLGSGPAYVLGPDATPDPPPLQPRTAFDPLSYGEAGAGQRALSALGPVTRSFDYRIGIKHGYLDGREGNWFTINGRLIPRVPMFMVSVGDVVRWRIVNNTNVVHPMHPHGHHALVVSRNGVPSTGAAWWVDSLEVAPGESYVLQMVADNPGVWMFHCHSLPHARAGLVTHLGYHGVRTPYRIGRVSARLVNSPE